MGFWKLKGKIIEKCQSQTNFCEEYGISEVALIDKLKGRVPFKSTEIVKMSEFLGIPKEEILDYFFAFDVQQS